MSESATIGKRCWASLGKHVDEILNSLNARQMLQCILQKLLQIERGNAATYHQDVLATLKLKCVRSSSKVGMVCDQLASAFRKN
jgi:hypothetical protein